jgi:hypothetical protein
VNGRRNPQRPSSLPLLAVVGVTIGAAGGWIATMPAPERTNLVGQVAETVTELRPEPRPYRHFAGCNDARAAGYENITSDEPSYRQDMDGDGDGIACEPYR